MAILKSLLSWPRSLYDWLLGWGDSRHGLTALFVLAVAEASFFPIPPDALLIALCMGAHRKWLNFAIVCSVGSIIGGILGYFIGYLAYDMIGEKLLTLTASFSGTEPAELLAVAQYWFNEKEMFGLSVGPWAVGIAGFTPIPYKVFTIASGFFEMSFVPFVIAGIPLAMIFLTMVSLVTCAIMPSRPMVLRFGNFAALRRRSAARFSRPISSCSLSWSRKPR